MSGDETTSTGVDSLSGRGARRERLVRVAMVVGSATFFLGGLDALQHGDLLVGIPSLAAAAVNLAAVLTVASRKRATDLLVNALNAAMALVMAFAAIRAGKSYIQYAWIVCTLGFLFAIARSARRTTSASRPGL